MSQTKDSSFLHFNEGEVTSKNAVNYGINPNHTSSHQVTLSKTIISQKQPPNINEHVRISDDEYVIKDYNAAKVKKPTKGEAHVALTNKRAIIYYWTQKGVLVNDARITEVLGTNVFWAKRQRRKLGTTAIALGILSMIACLFIIPMLMPGSILVGAPLIAVGIYYLCKTRHSFVFIVYIRAVTGALSFANYPVGTLEKALTPEKIQLEGKPGVDSETLAKEIGAMILDIQKGVGS